MFRYDKDMERVMLEKKKEVLAEIETAKLRVLKELYCLKRSVHTDFCEMLADYNRIDFTLKKLVKDLKAEIKTTTDEFRVLMGDTFNEYTTRIENKFTALETFEQEVIQEVNAKLSELETMSAQVEALIAEMEQIVADGVTQAELDALDAKFTEMINNVDVSDELNAIAAELREEIANAGVQSDWNEVDETSKAFVKNKPFGRYGRVAALGSTTLNLNVTGEETTVTLKDKVRESAVGDYVWQLRLKNDTSVTEMHPLTPFMTPRKNYSSGVYELCELQTEGLSVRVYAEKTGETMYDSDKPLEYDPDQDRYVDAYSVIATFTCTNSEYAELGLSVCSALVETQKIDPLFMGVAPGPMRYLRMNEDALPMWTSLVCVLGDDGSYYSLGVSADGSVKATKMT